MSNSLMRIFATWSRENENLFPTVTSGLMSRPSWSFMDGRWVPHYGSMTNKSGQEPRAAISLQVIFEMSVSKVQWTILYPLLTVFAISPGRLLDCLKAGSINLWPLCWSGSPMLMSLLWTGWTGPVIITPHQQKTPDWWEKMWPSLWTGWRCAEKSISSFLIFIPSDLQ